MKNYQVDASNKWDYENGFYLTCDTGRIGKFLNHFDIFKQIKDLEGDVYEFGVYKGASFVRLISFRDLVEKNSTRNIIGFDAFGKFPRELSLDSDKQFVEQFEDEGGHGISKEDLTMLLNRKGFKNYSLVAGDISKTLAIHIAQNPEIKIALLHIDVDVYEPTKLILEQLWDRLVSGGILMLDDYDLVDGGTRAIDEFFSGKNIEIIKPKYYHVPQYVVKR